jgi:aromatic ring hydroxylase
MREAARPGRPEAVAPAALPVAVKREAQSAEAAAEVVAGLAGAPAAASGVGKAEAVVAPVGVPVAVKEEAQAAETGAESVAEAVAGLAGVPAVAAGWAVEPSSSRCPSRCSCSDRDFLRPSQRS